MGFLHIYRQWKTLILWHMTMFDFMLLYAIFKNVTRETIKIPTIFIYTLDIIWRNIIDGNIEGIKGMTKMIEKLHYWFESLNILYTGKSKS